MAPTRPSFHGRGAFPQTLRWALRGSNPRPSPCKGGTPLQVSALTGHVAVPLRTPRYLLSASALLRGALRRLLCVDHSIEVPAIWDTVELVLACVFGCEARFRHQAVHRLRDKHLVEPQRASVGTKSHRACPV